MNANKTAPTIQALAAALGCNQNAAKSRMVALGYVEKCSRCGGSGRYSFNPMDGDRCFRCGGKGKSLVKITAKLITEAKARQDAGELNDYFAACRARAEAQRAIEPSMAELNHECGAGGIRAHYERHNAINVSCHVFVNSDYFRASSLLCSIKDHAFEAYMAWKYRGASHEATLAVIREMIAFAKLVNAAAAPMVDGWHEEMVLAESLPR